MPVAEGADGTDANGVKLSPAQEAAIERIKRTGGGVAAGRAMFEERKSPAAKRRAERD